MRLTRRIASFLAMAAAVFHGGSSAVASSTVNVPRLELPKRHLLSASTPDTRNWPYKGKNRNQRRRLSAAFQSF